MIEKEFVPYTEALALKELGFNEPCFGFWNYNDSKMYYWNDEEIQNERTNKWFLDTEKKFPKISKNGCTAPTFSQAFRWFRYKYWYTALILCDSFQIVMQLSTSKTLDSKTGEYIANYSTQTYHKEEGLKSYDESELACLRKLIEIVKENLIIK